jgi:two-component system cell cycle response regulator
MLTATNPEALCALMSMKTKPSIGAERPEKEPDLSIVDLQALVLRLRTELQRAHEGLGYQATRDSLTGLWNRAAILNILRQEVARSDREHKPFGVIAFAVDNFKEINEEHGEMVGDSVLRAVARRMLPEVRPYDSAGRLSSNQFLIVAPGCDTLGATNMAERIRKTIAEESTDVTLRISQEVDEQPEEQRILATLSLGVFTTDSAQDPDRLFKGTQETLRAAKQAGGNRVVMATMPEA